MSWILEVIIKTHLKYNNKTEQLKNLCYLCASSIVRFDTTFPLRSVISPFLCHFLLFLNATGSYVFCRPVYMWLHVVTIYLLQYLATCENWNTQNMLIPWRCACEMGPLKLACPEKQLNWDRPSDEPTETEALCHSRCGTIRIPQLKRCIQPSVLNNNLTHKLY